METRARRIAERFGWPAPVVHVIENPEDAFRPSLQRGITVWRKLWQALDHGEQEQYLATELFTRFAKPKTDWRQPIVILLVCIAGLSGVKALHADAWRMQLAFCVAWLVLSVAAFFQMRAELRRLFAASMGLTGNPQAAERLLVKRLALRTCGDPKEAVTNPSRKVKTMYHLLIPPELRSLYR